MQIQQVMMFTNTVLVMLAAACPSLAIERISLTSSNMQTNGDNYEPSLSANGRIVSFEGQGSNVVPGLPSCCGQAYVRNRDLSTTEAVAVSTGGVLADRDSSFSLYRGNLSANGRYTVFSTDASNLAADAGVHEQIYLRDRQNKTTRLISTTAAGTVGNSASFHPIIAGQGRYVFFASAGTNLIQNDNNGFWDCYRKDISNGKLVFVSRPSSGGQFSGNCLTGGISPDGRFAAFTIGVGSEAEQAYVRDVTNNTTTLISLTPKGLPGNGKSRVTAISADGRWALFCSSATDLVKGDVNNRTDAFLRDLLNKRTRRISVSPTGAGGDGHSSCGSMSDDGKFIAYVSNASNLVTGDENESDDVFLYNRVSKTNTRLTRYLNEATVDHEAIFDPAISANGRVVAFVSFGLFVAGDTNNALDAFVIDLP